KHLATARQNCISLREKRVTLHVLRHTSAMALLQGGVDTSSIALWLGHESPATTHIYLEANLALKEKILGKMETWNGTKTRSHRLEFPEESVSMPKLCRVVGEETRKQQWVRRATRHNFSGGIASQIVRRQLRHSDTPGGFLHDVPNRLYRHPISPCPSYFVDP